MVTIRLFLPCRFTTEGTHAASPHTKDVVRVTQVCSSANETDQNQQKRQQGDDAEGYEECILFINQLSLSY